LCIAGGPRSDTMMEDLVVADERAELSVISLLMICFNLLVGKETGC
jgi:hypothetical protein